MTRKRTLRDGSKVSYRNLYTDRARYGVNPDGTIKSGKQVMIENFDKNIKNLETDLIELLDIISQVKTSGKFLK